MSDDAKSAIQISVVVLNYNGATWLARCIESILAQTLPNIELIVADNQSTDGSDALAAKLLEGHPNARFIQNGANLGYCEGNNKAANVSAGKYILLLNNDAWLEPDCLEVLMRETERVGAAAGTPLVLNWSDETLQYGAFARGFDFFGLPSFGAPNAQGGDLMMPGGCSYFILRDLFFRFGGLDPVIYMYADEWDLSWKVWISGHRALLVAGARAHHRGAVNVNPEGGERVVQMRTSDMKRYYSNRNCLLVLAKNCQHILLLLLPLQLILLLLEALVALILIRRWSFIKRSYINAIRDFFGLMPHIRRERAKVKAFRRRGDFYMLRFFRLRLNRWDEFLQMVRMGVPRVDSR